MPFKKHLLAAAALAACAASGGVIAGNVSMYGAVDTGLTYTHISSSHFNKLEMSTGNYAGSRVGLRGSEDLGNGVSIHFILESGFKSDDGTLGQNGGLFGRESQLSLQGSWGTLGFGRVGAFSSGSSSLGWYWDLEPFETGYIDAGIQATQINVWRLNSNVVYYISPTIGGAKLGLQYGLTGRKDKEAAHFSDNDGWFNAALRWDGQNARALLGFEHERIGLPDAANGFQKRQDDAFNVKLAGAWNPAGGPATLYAGASWYKNYNKFSDSTYDDDYKIAWNPEGRQRLEGYSAFIGVKYAAGKADLLAMLQYLDGENKDPALDGSQSKDYTRYVGSIGCHYHVSKSTMLYAIGSYADGDDLFKSVAHAAAGNGRTDSNRFMAHLGMTHWF